MHYSTQRRRKKIISIQKVDCVVVPLSSYLSSTSREKLKYIVPLFLRLSCITMKQWGCDHKQDIAIVSFTTSSTTFSQFFPFPLCCRLTSTTIHSHFIFRHAYTDTYTFRHITIIISLTFFNNFSAVSELYSLCSSCWPSCTTTSNLTYIFYTASVSAI